MRLVEPVLSPVSQFHHNSAWINELNFVPICSLYTFLEPQ